MLVVHDAHQVLETDDGAFVGEQRQAVLDRPSPGTPAAADCADE
jgi:hypothetical protein